MGQPQRYRMHISQNLSEETVAKINGDWVSKPRWQSWKIVAVTAAVITAFFGSTNTNESKSNSQTVTSKIAKK